MKNRLRAAPLTCALLLAGWVWTPLNTSTVSAQEESHTVNQNAPESVTGTMEGNQTDLLSSWHFLSGLAVRLLSGNEAELLSGNSPELLSSNSATLLSGNKVFSGNTLFSGNTVEVHITESGNPTLGWLAKSLASLPAPRPAAGERAKAVAAKQKAQAMARTGELNKMRQQIAKLAEQNAKLKMTIEKLKAESKATAADR